MTDRNVYIAIMTAAAKGTGLHLSAYEVACMSGDDAIEVHAINCLDDSDWPEHSNPTGPGPAWAKIDPKRRRAGANLGSIAPETRNSDRCPSCHRSDAEYNTHEGYCRDPWHGDDHLRRSQSVTSQPRGSEAE